MGSRTRWTGLTVNQNMAGSIPAPTANFMKCLWKSCSKEFIGSTKATNQRFCSKKCGNCYGVSKRRRLIKEMAVAHKGGKCQLCGYDKYVEALQFHHKDPSQKDFSISTKGWTRSWESVKTEIEKCDLLCVRCHAETHVKLRLE